MSFINKKTGETKIVPTPPLIRTWIVGVRGPDGQAAERITGRLERFDEKPGPVGVPSSHLDVQFTLPTDLEFGSTYRGIFSADGCGELETVITATGPNDPVRIVQLPSGHFDPSWIPLEQLARIRGAMWPKMNVPLGPRPNRDDNVASTDFLWNYDDPTRLRILQTLRGMGYTHAEYGPLKDSDGYHGLWTPNDWTQKWDQFLDMLEFSWDHGIAPVVFIKPDNWSFEQTRDTLTSLLRQPRAQTLIRIGVPAGWEPGGDYSWSSYTWVKFFQWFRETMPHALCLYHNAVKRDGAPPDAPVGGDANGNDDGHPNGEGWRRCAPYLHGWLVQSGPFAGTPSDLPDRGREWGAMFERDGDGATFHGVAWHFAHGIDGWPTGSAWGPNRPVILYAAEQSAYQRFWHGSTNEQARPWGDLAVQKGAGGYFDGGSVPVGDGPVSWQR